MSAESREIPPRRAWLTPNFRVSDRLGRGIAEKAEAQAQWKSHWGPTVWVSLVLAAGLHAALLLSARESPVLSQAIPIRGPVVSELIVPRLIDVALPTVPASLTVTPPLQRGARTFERLLGETAPRGRETTIVLEIALDLPAPVEIREAQAIEPPPLPTFAAVADEWASYTRFAPSMVRPEIINQDEMRRFLDRRYARLVRTTGMEGTVVLRFWIDEEGMANKVEINTSSGFTALDNLALELAEILRFSPAYQMGDAIRVFVELPIRFQAI